MSQDEPGNTLAQLSDGLAAAVERAAASTVAVKARPRIPASGIAWAADGVVVTCDHVVESDDNIAVVLPGGAEAKAKLLGRDPGTDLAVLKVEGQALTAAERAPAEAGRVGHMVLALGRPGTRGPMASLGVVSAVGGAWRTFRGANVEGYLRTDATFYPGFSGGPLVDVRGRVLGVISSRLGRGAGLVIPTNVVAGVVEALIKQGRIRRGYLGIGSQVARLQAAAAEKLGGQETGLIIVMVEPGSPADLGGLVVGDVVVKVEGSAVRDTDELQATLGPDRVGQPLQVTVLRGGDPHDVTVTVGERK
jgi:serine protease DegQ